MRPHTEMEALVMRWPEQVPQALRGTRPRWWAIDQPVLAYGPFLVEYSPTAAIVGFLLRENEHDSGAWCYSDGDRVRMLVRTGEPVVNDRGIAVPTVHGAVLIRPLRPDDERWVTLYDLPDEDDGDLAARVRKARNW